MMSPFKSFAAGLFAAQKDIVEVLEELRGYAEIMSRKENSVEMDENGQFYVVATGDLDTIIPNLQKQLQKLERIKKLRDPT